MATTRIAVITTGGTIDKAYARGEGILDLHIGSPYAFARLLEVMTKPGHVRECELMRKDSTCLTADDRLTIVDTCRMVSETNIIITHGTDTMRDTALVLHESGLGVHKTIVLTGALQPARMVCSDADFNLGLALAGALLAPPGIYIAIGSIEPWHTVAKDPQSGRFLPVQP